MKKYKAIAIPVSFADEKPKFLTVRDRRFKDWIFVTGGCRRREIFNPPFAALFVNSRKRPVVWLPSKTVSIRSLNLQSKRVQRWIWNIMFSSFL